MVGEERVLRISEELGLPLRAVTQRFGILAETGAGKTYTALVIAEEMLGAGVQVVMIDPLGVGWGLRSSADGESEGLPIVVFGGDRGDVPLDHTAGRMVADLVVDEQLSVVLDLSDFSGGQATRFVQDFAEQVFQRSKRPIHLIVDEADAFAPQRPQPGEQRMLGAMEKLVRRGRVKGIGVTLITQRPAVLNKNVLTQVQCLIVGRISAPQDRKAIETWVEANASVEDRNLVLGSLAELATGEVWVWSPHFLRLLKRLRIRTRTTFDSSATPEVGTELREPPRLAPVDLARLRDLLAVSAPDEQPVGGRGLQSAVISGPPPRVSHERLAAAEILGLRDRVRELESEVAELRARLAVSVGPEAWARVREGFAALMGCAEEFSAGVEAVAAGVAVAVDSEPRSDRPHPPPLSHGERGDGDAARRRAANGGSVLLDAYSKRLIDPLARRSPLRCTKLQLARLSGCSNRSSQFSARLSQMKQEGLIDESGGKLGITPAGLDALGVMRPAPAKTMREVLAMWRGALSRAEMKFLHVLIAAYPSALPKARLAELTGYSVTSSSFGASLSALREAGLVERRGSEWAAVAEQLFLEG